MVASWAVRCLFILSCLVLPSVRSFITSQRYGDVPNNNALTSMRVSQNSDSYILARRKFVTSSLVSLITVFGTECTFSKKLAWAKTTSTALQLEDARDQIDLVVQACSVQAWVDAYELVSDSSLDNLEELFVFNKEDVDVISNGINSLRDRLKDVTSLPTKEAIEVMSIGTQTRSAMEKYISSTK